MTAERGARFAFPNPLPKPPPRGMERDRIASQFRETLRTHFARRSDVLVAGLGYVCQDADDDIENWVVPDAVIAFGVDPESIRKRNGYAISEVGKPPDFVLDISLSADAIANAPPEFVSDMSLNEDIERKRGIYASFGIPESWRFASPFGRISGTPLSGAALANGEYRPIKIVREPSGMIWGRSAVLGLDIRRDAGDLRLSVSKGGEFLRSHAEERAGRLDAEARFQAERERRQAAEAELHRLRDRLRREGLL